MGGANAEKRAFLRVGRGIHNAEGSRSRVVLANLSSRPIRIPAGTAVALGYDATGYEVLDVDVGSMDAASSAVAAHPTVARLRTAIAAVSRAERSATGGDGKDTDGGTYDNPFYAKDNAGGARVEQTPRAAAHTVRRPDGNTPRGSDDGLGGDTPPDDPDIAPLWAKLPDDVRATLAQTRIVRTVDELPEHLRKVEVGTTLTTVQRRLVWTLLATYADVFNDLPKVPTQTTRFRAGINTGDAAPVRASPYRTSPKEKEIIDRQIDEMLEAGVIKPSRSPWSSAVILVPKKDGTIRFCVDYRRLNAVTRVETYPLPRVDETLRAFEGAACFSVMDMQSGYWQIPLKEEDYEKTAFTTHRGLYEYVVLPFGPVNAPGYFQRMMDEVVGDLKWTSVLVYIDDLIVFSPTYERHLLDLAVVFTRLREAGLTLKPSKCRVFATEVLFLGHLVSKDGTGPNPDKVRAITAMQPATRAEVVSFVAMAGYYRRYIRNYAALVAPLLAITRKEVDFAAAYGETHTAIIADVKARLTSQPILAHPDFSRPFSIMTDASGQGVGAVLTQRADNGDERVIEYASKSHDVRQRTWSPTEQEAWAVVWACELFRPYVYMTKFTVYTDHRALRWLFANKSTNARLTRWGIQLMEHQFQVVHRPGKSNANADGPSRLPLPPGDGRGEHAEDTALARMRVLKRTREDYEATTGRTGTPGDAVTEDRWAPGTVERRRVNNHAALAAAGHGSLPASLPSIGEFRAHYEQDPRIRGLYAYVVDGVSLPGTDPDTYAAAAAHHVKDGHLLKRILGQTDAVTSTERMGTRVVVPLGLRARIIAHHHATAEAGHKATKPTFERIRSIFWWPRMWRDVARVVDSCSVCQLQKAQPDGRAGRLAPINVSRPWELVGVDLVGPFKRTKAGCQHILTMIDYFTRWVIFVQLRETKARDVVDAIMTHLVHKFGPPEGVVSDQGRQFSGGLFQRVMSRLQVVHARTTAYHPQANGRVERVHRSLNTMLAAQCNARHDDWDEYVSAAAWAVNTGWTRSTGFTPYELLFGQPARTPSAILYGTREEAVRDLTEYQLRLCSTLRHAHGRVMAANHKYVQRMVEHYDAHRKTTRYAPGDMVRLYHPESQPHMPRRLQYRWTGPHTVLARCTGSDLNYVIRVADGRDIICHVGRLKRYTPSIPSSDPDLPHADPRQVEERSDEHAARERTGHDSVPADAPDKQKDHSAADGADAAYDDPTALGRVEDGTLWDIGAGTLALDESKSHEGADADNDPTEYNALTARVRPQVAADDIRVGHIVLYWTDDGDGARWWIGRVRDSPARDRPSTTTLEVQPFNTRNATKGIAQAIFTLVWWDVRAKKEDWRMTAKGAHLHTMLMTVPAANVMMTEVRLTRRRHLPDDVLTTLAAMGVRIGHRCTPEGAATAVRQAHRAGTDQSRPSPTEQQSRPAPSAAHAEGDVVMAELRDDGVADKTRDSVGESPQAQDVAMPAPDAPPPTAAGTARRSARIGQRPWTYGTTW